MEDREINRTESIESLAAVPSLIESASITEDERRRILEGIFAEDDDEEEKRALTILENTTTLAENSETEVTKEPLSEAAKDIPDEVVNNNIKEEFLSSNDVDVTTKSNEEDLNIISSSAFSQTSHPHKSFVTARRRIESENAFSSSSDEDDIDVERIFNTFNTSHPDNVTNGKNDVASKHQSLDFSVYQDSRKISSAHHKDSPQQQQQQQHMVVTRYESDDNADSAIPDNFTWTHSAESAEEDDEVSYSIYDAIAQSRKSGDVNDKDPVSSLNQNDATVGSAENTSSFTKSPIQFNSSFDSGEIQQQNFAGDLTHPDSNKVIVTSSFLEKMSEISVKGLSSTPSISNNTNISDLISNTTDDDFLAKAEHNVLDEILSKNPDDDNAELYNDNNSKRLDARSSSRRDAKSKRTSTDDSSLTNDKISSQHFRSQIKTNAVASSSIRPKPEDVIHKLPDVLSSVRQKIESLTMIQNVGGKSSSSRTQGDYLYYPSSVVLSSSSLPNNTTKTTDETSTSSTTLDKYYKDGEERDSLRRTFQQCISAAVLVSLAHKRYERRRLAAMEIEKVTRSLVAQDDYTRVRAILLTLSDDYARSTNEDARKGGAVALAACAIGLKKANEGRSDVKECRDLILASVVHACQDHSQRVRYYATESLFNVTKVIPSLAVQHFFILFEILRSLYADVDLDVRSGAELLDKKLKEVIIGAINSGSFSADACVPVFARFVYMRNKATKKLVLTWLQEFSEKLIGAPILEFLHLFLGGIFAIVADPNATVRQLALDFLQSILPKLLVNNEDFEDAQQKVDFDKILQSLVLTMEHPDPFVRKVAMYWMSRIVQAHISYSFIKSHRFDAKDADEIMGVESVKGLRGIDISISSPDGERPTTMSQHLTVASISVRNALPHVLPGILLCIGDTHQSRVKDTFLPDQTTHSLAEQANSCLQDAVRRDGKAFIPYLGGFIMALREEFDSPGGFISRNPPSVERRPYRMDVKPDGSGIESTGWFRESDGIEERDNALILSRLCALNWVAVLHEYVVPNSLKDEYASEFINCLIYQLVDQPPGIITLKSFEVLAKITIPSEGETSRSIFSSTSLSDDESNPNVRIPSRDDPTNDENANFALGILEPSRRKLISRDREVFASIIDLHSKYPKLLMDLSKVIELMCTLQPPEFIFLAFANELDIFVVSRMKHREKILESPETDAHTLKKELSSFAKDLAFVSNFVQQLGIVFFAAPEVEQLRRVLKDSIGCKSKSVRDERRTRLFYILLHTFSHNIVTTLSFCLWGGAYLTAATFLLKIDPLDVSLMFYLEIDQLIDLIERPLFRHLHLRMLEFDDDPYKEGSGAMLFRTLKCIMMLLPHSTSYMILQERLSSMARFRQSTISFSGLSKRVELGSETDIFVKRVIRVRKLHCDAKWRNIRAESLEEPCRIKTDDERMVDAQRQQWIGNTEHDDEIETEEKLKNNFLGFSPKEVELVGASENLNEMELSKAAHFESNEALSKEYYYTASSRSTKGLIQQFEKMSSNCNSKEPKPEWREYWSSANKNSK